MQARVALTELKALPQRHRLVGWLTLVDLRIHIALAIFQLYVYRDLEAEDNQFLKS